MKIKRKDLQDKVAKYAGAPRPKLYWSIYTLEKELEEDQFENEILDVPFNSFDDIFCEGEVAFESEGWANKIKMTSPKWKDVIWAAERFVDGASIFLENIEKNGEWKNRKLFQFTFGS